MDAPAADAAATATPAAGEPTSAATPPAAPAPKPPLQQFLETVLRVGAAEAPTHVVPQIADKRGQRKKEDLRQTVLIHLFEPSLEVLSAVIRQSPGSDSAAVAMSLVLLLQQSHRTEEFLRRELSTRLQTAQKIGTSAITNVLRDNSLVVMMVMAFAQLEGMDFMRATFEGPLTRVLDMEKPLEVNPAKGVDDATVHANIEQLERVCSEILASIDSQRELITPAFRRMCNFVRKAVEEALDSPVTAAADAALTRADEAAAAASPVRPSPSLNLGPSATYLTPALKVLSSFFFLRYAVPAVTSPQKYCVIPADRPVPPAQQVSLVYIAKVLTSLCNGVPYGQKELYMTPLNPFLHRHEETMKNFLNYISELPRTAPGVPRFECEPHIVEAALDHIFAYLSNVLPRVNVAELPPAVQAHIQVLLGVIPSDKPAASKGRFGTVSLGKAARKLILSANPGPRSSSRSAAAVGFAAALTGSTRSVAPLSAEWFGRAMGVGEEGAAALIAANLLAGVELPPAALDAIAAAMEVTVWAIVEPATAAAYARSPPRPRSNSVTASPTKSTGTSSPHVDVDSLISDAGFLEAANVDKALPPLPASSEPPADAATAAMVERERQRLFKMLKKPFAAGSRSHASATLTPASTSTTGGASAGSVAFPAAPFAPAAAGPSAVAVAGGSAAADPDAAEVTTADIANALVRLPPGLQTALAGGDPTRLWVSAAELAAQFAAAAESISTPAALDLAATAKLQLALSQILERILVKTGQTTLGSGRAAATEGDVAAALAGLDGWKAFAAPVGATQSLRSATSEASSATTATPQDKPAEAAAAPEPAAEATDASPKPAPAPLAAP